MERTQTNQADTPFFQLYEIADHLINTRSFKDFIYGLSGNHPTGNIRVFLSDRMTQSRPVTKSLLLMPSYITLMKDQKTGPFLFMHKVAPVTLVADLGWEKG